MVEKKEIEITKCEQQAVEKEGDAKRVESIGMKKKKFNLSWQDTRSLTGKEREEKRKEKEKRSRVVIYVMFGLGGF